MLMWNDFHRILGMTAIIVMYIQLIIPSPQEFESSQISIAELRENALHKHMWKSIDLRYQSFLLNATYNMTSELLEKLLRAYQNILSKENSKPLLIKEIYNSILILSDMFRYVQLFLPFSLHIASLSLSGCWICFKNHTKLTN